MAQVYRQMCLVTRIASGGSNHTPKGGRQMNGATIAILAAVASAGLGILTLGLPGAIIFAACGPLLRVIFGSDALERLPPDSMWPIAILIALLWPISMIIGYLVGFQ